MKILVRTLSTPQGPLWQVRMDQHAVSFRSEAQAREFVTTLEARLKAPHHLPQFEQRAAG
ncbi:hypothetical protein ACVW0Y_002132 [Pseudomonas sp. TE3786]